MRAPQVSVLVTQVRGNQAAVRWQVNRPSHLPTEAQDLSLPDLFAVACHHGEVQRLGTRRPQHGLTVMQACASSDGVNARGTEKGTRVRRKCQDGKLQVLLPAMTTSCATPTCSAC